MVCSQIWEEYESKLEKFLPCHRDHFRLIVLPRTFVQSKIVLGLVCSCSITTKLPSQGRFFHSEKEDFSWMPDITHNPIDWLDPPNPRAVTMKTNIDQYYTIFYAPKHSDLFFDVRNGWDVATVLQWSNIPPFLSNGSHVHQKITLKHIQTPIFNTPL